MANYLYIDRINSSGEQLFSSTLFHTSPYMLRNSLLKFVRIAIACIAVVAVATEAYAQKLEGPGYYNANQSGGDFVLSQGFGPYLHMFANNNSNSELAGTLNFISGYNPNGSAVMHSFVGRDASGNYPRLMEILQNGQVRIGSGARTPTTQTDYKLAVAGKLVSQSLYVTNPTTWADFVFAPTYKGMSLADLETYLLRYKHLPAIPPASEVIANGYSVTDMDAKLLQTVEELTLQLIKLSKEVEELKRQKATAVKEE